VQKLKDRVHGARMLTMETGPQFLRNLEQRTNDDCHEVLITADSHVMRGVDFRGGAKGICLILDQGMESEREVYQSLHRVGRQGEPCERYVTSGTRALDAEQHLAFKQRLVAIHQTLRRQKALAGSAACLGGPDTRCQDSVGEKSELEMH
jgi:hypothetical protein